MEYRSTNPDGRFVHYGGALVVGTEFGSGIEINPASSAAVANIKPAGDETSKDIRIAGKGTGGARLGAASTTPVSLVQRYVVEFTEPDSAASTYVDSTYTVSGATTNAAYTFTPRVRLAAGYSIGDVRCSTADEVTIRWVHTGGSTASGSSNRGTLLQFGF